VFLLKEKGYGKNQICTSCTNSYGKLRAKNEPNTENSSPQVASSSQSQVTCCVVEVVTVQLLVLVLFGGF
jgi:hypothetical protein